MGKFKISKKIIILVVLVVSLLSTAYFVASHYITKYYQQPKFAVEKINLAIAMEDKVTLESFINLKTVVDKIANDLTPYLKGEEKNISVKQRSEEIFENLYKIVFGPRLPKPKVEEPKEGEEAEGAKPAPKPKEEPKPKFEILKTSPTIIPPGMMDDFVANPFILQAFDEEHAVIVSKVQHHQLPITFEIKLAMQLIDGQWKIIEFSNFDKMAVHYLNTVNAETEKALMAIEAENDRVFAYVNEHYDVSSCSANIFGPDKYGIIHLRINLNGMNKGVDDLVASSVFVSFSDGNNKKLSTMRVENPNRVPGESTFKHEFSFTFESNVNEAVQLLNAGDLKCTAKTIGAGIGRANYLYPENWRKFIE